MMALRGGVRHWMWKIGWEDLCRPGFTRREGGCRHIGIRGLWGSHRTLDAALVVGRLVVTWKIQVQFTENNLMDISFPMQRRFLPRLSSSFCLLWVSKLWGSRRIRMECMQYFCAYLTRRQPILCLLDNKKSHVRYPHFVPCPHKRADYLCIL